MKFFVTLCTDRPFFVSFFWASKKMKTAGRQRQITF
jgi:hypothetical protein